MTTTELAAMTTNQTHNGLTSADIHALTTTQFVALHFDERRPIGGLSSSDLAATQSASEKAVSLRQRVGTLVNAMAAFDAESTASTSTATKSLEMPDMQNSPAVAIGSNVSSMVDEMRRFDAGNALAKPGEKAATERQLAISATHDSGYLVVPPK